MESILNQLTLHFLYALSLFDQNRKGKSFLIKREDGNLEMGTREAGSTTDLVSIVYGSMLVVLCLMFDDACIYVLPAYFMVQ